MRTSLFAWSVLLGISGCTQEGATPVPLGAPLPELNAAELERFRQGEALFNRVFTVAEGVGPLFNENQCSACHTSPAAGGTGEQILLKGTRFTPPDRCDPLTAQGGENVRTQVTDLLRAQGVDRQPFPDSATERGRFTAPFLFGLGLIEAIPDDEIRSRADPDDRDRNGISGRPGRDARGALGRFGRKAETATIRDFVDTALRFEMGLTTVPHPNEASLDGRPFPPSVDPAPEPEISTQVHDRLVDFVRFLAPPSRRPRETAAERETVRRGEDLFHRLGCDLCHVPAMRTGPSEVDALNRQRVFLYSDLLLHDLGPALASTCGIAAAPAETRTASLLGLGRRKVFLHDGRTLDLGEAILLHGGEAEAAKQRFRSLDRLSQEALFQFLRTL